MGNNIIFMPSTGADRKEAGLPFREERLSGVRRGATTGEDDRGEPASQHRRNVFGEQCSRIAGWQKLADSEAPLQHQLSLELNGEHHQRLFFFFFRLSDEVSKIKKRF